MHLLSRTLKNFTLSIRRNIMNCGKIVWMDCEMTVKYLVFLLINMLFIFNFILGLDVERCRVIETSMIVTDENLSIISPEFNIVIKQTDDILNNMDEWCMKNLEELAGASKKSSKNMIWI